MVTPRAASTEAELVERLFEDALIVPNAPSTLEDELETFREAAWLAVIAAFVVVSAASTLADDVDRFTEDV